jgi:hypothetical protein
MKAEIFIQPEVGYAERVIPNLHPTLDFEDRERIVEEISQVIAPKLYLVPTPDWVEGEEDIDPDDGPHGIPTPSSELPEINGWVSRFILTVIEIWSGQRAANQLTRWTHRRVLNELSSSPITSQSPKIRRIYISAPIDGVAEVTVTMRFGERIKSLVLRFEGVDQRWLCTEMKLL